MKNPLNFLFLISIFIIQISCQSATEQAWPEESVTTKPWTRWWWMGSAVDDKNLTQLLVEYDQKGIGGVEITPIYGAKGFEDQYLEFLSEEWMNSLYTVIRVADSLGMGVDMNLGTGWPYGGPHIEPEFAATRMVIQKYDLKKGKKLKKAIVIEDEKQAKLNVKINSAMAYAEEGYKDLTSSLSDDGQLDWVADKDYTVYAVFTGKTRQQVKRAAPGGKGFVMDHLNKAAFEDHVARFEEAFSSNTPAIRSYFNDSYEVYGADFTASFFDDFKELRGYDLREYLPLLVEGDTTEIGLRVRADYRKTMGQLLLSNFTNPWNDWAKKQGALTRNQAHGSPANLLDVYAAVDIPECETFGWTDFEISGRKVYTETSRHTPPDPFMLKMASSSANILGKPLVSSETFTWLGEHFKVPLSQAKPELDQAFLSGVNHVFFHGTTYSPEEAGWPGWLFYASTNFAPTNSFWSHIDGLNNYISRCQSVLQAGKPASDVLLYFPYEDMVHYSGMKRREYGFTVHNIPEWLWPTAFYQQAKVLTKAGYAIDYLSDDILSKLTVKDGRLSVNAEGAEYKAIVIPKMNFISLQTLQNLQKLMDQGATIVFQELPQDVPGQFQLEERRAEFKKVISSQSFSNGEPSELLSSMGIKGESLNDSGLKFIKRIVEESTYYFLVNPQSTAVDAFVPLNASFKKAVVMNALTGASGNAETDGNKVHVQLKSGESLILEVGNAGVAENWNYTDEAGSSQTIAGPWSLSYGKGGPTPPADQVLENIKPWTSLGDSAANYFSGSATYQASFEVDQLEGAYLLDLGDVRESAKVWINGEYIGNSWSIPHELRVGPELKSGQNEIKIEVANLMANRIRYMDREGVEWKKYHEINFVNIDYRPFDASDWDVQPSGLMGPVRLIPME